MTKILSYILLTMEKVLDQVMTGIFGLHPRHLLMALPGQLISERVWEVVVSSMACAGLEVGVPTMMPG